MFFRVLKFPEKALFLVGAMALFMASCAGSPKEPVVSVPENTGENALTLEESFLESAPFTLDSLDQRESYVNYRYGLDALENEEWLAANHYFDLALKKFIEERTDSTLNTEVHQKYNREFLQKLLLALDETYPKLAYLGENAESYNPYELSLEGLEENQETADSALLEVIENFLDTLDKSQFTLPLELNERVLQEIYYFTEVVPGFINASLTRKTAYDSLIYGILNEYEMPVDLIYLSLVESGFKVRAYSRAKASGLWQFIPATGERYGLKTDFWIDMRRNPELATRAAAAYLTYLYNDFDDWLLAMAAYNCGEGRVRRLIREKMADSTWESDKKVTYWDLNLPKETMHYVPRILAAMVIGHFPKHYGIEVKQTHLPEYDTVSVKDCLPITEIAKALSISEDSVRALNMELIKWSTPPDAYTYTLRIPRGMRDKFMAAYAKMDKNKFPHWHYHKVLRGENLSLIAKKYGVKASDIQDANRMNKSTRLRAGQQLLIPLPPSATGNGSMPAKKASSTKKVRTHTVKENESQAAIARRYGISIANLRRWNNLNESSVLLAGQELFVSEVPLDSKPFPKGFNEENAARVIKNGKYEVRSGDTYASIAAYFNVELEELLLKNGGDRRRLKVGDNITIPKTQVKKEDKVAKVTSKSAEKNAKDKKTAQTKEKQSVYIVVSGDNLSQISKKTGVSVQNLKEWNGLKSDKIEVGKKLQLKAPVNKTSKADNAKKNVYTVKKGEALWDIAKRYGVSIEDLLKWNGLSDTKIKAGQKLQVEK